MRRVDEGQGAMVSCANSHFGGVGVRGGGLLSTAGHGFVMQALTASLA